MPIVINPSSLDKYYKSLVCQIRYRCVESGVRFDIGVSDLEGIHAEYCPYFGYKLVYVGGMNTDSKANVDRIVPNLVYVPGNIRFISRLANTMKSCATEEQLILFAQAILRLHSVDSVC